MNITRSTSPNFNKGRSNQTPDMLVCHITEGAYAGAVSWLANPESGVSSHFVVARDGRITQLVDIADTAWANGTSLTPGSNVWNGHSTLKAVRERGINANLYSISIEHEGRFAETGGALAPAQLEATIALIAHIRAEVQRIYGFTIPLTRQNIVGHNEIAPKVRANCPGAQFPFAEIIKRLQDMEAPVPPASEPSRWAKEAWAWVSENRILDGTNPRKTATREQMATMLHRYHTQMGK